jgi:DNA-binding response OmpR family regulator
MGIGSIELGSRGKTAAAQSAYDILIVDDDVVVLLIIGESLRAEKLSVLTAQNASRAMQQLENKIRLIVLDVNLNGEDGLQLLDFLKINHPEIPIIIYTGLPHDRQEIIAMLKRGATCYIHKARSINEKSIHDLTFAIKTIRGGSKTAKS